MNYEKPAQIVETLRAELSHFGDNFKPEGATAVVRINELSLLSEPFIGYAEMDADQGKETYLFCRNYTPLYFRPADSKIEFASYLSPMGRIFAQSPGHFGEVVRRFVTLSAKAEFVPVREGKSWEAKHPRVSWDKQKVFADSLHELLPLLRARLDKPPGAPVEEPLIPLSLELKVRRPILQVTQLPDRAVLDEVQDPIFRHSIAGAILITGAPGTGKTTVQIKRLAQKTKWEFLTDEERSGFDKATWVDNEGWVFFTPTRLAGKLYSSFSGDAHTPADSVNPADNDPPVLVRHTPDAAQAAKWIAHRIQEIYDLSGGRLPTVGVLLPNEADVEPFAAQLREALFDASIDVEASLAGQSLGETNKVRVFCVDHIKGLEFESIFFCDIDVMAEKQGDLIDKFVYVGLSRARSFLGMTYRSTFPKKLDVLKTDLHFAERFVEDTALRPWRTYLDEDLVAQISAENQALLDRHFEFYWNLVSGLRAPKSGAQKAFIYFAKVINDGVKSTGKTEHEVAFGAFLEARALRGQV